MRRSPNKTQTATGHDIRTEVPIAERGARGVTTPCLNSHSLVGSASLNAPLDRESFTQDQA